MRHLVLVLGDQLDPGSAAFDGFDAASDAVWMAEVDEEATYVWSHRLRIAAFFAAMRNFRATLERRGIAVHYTELPAQPSRDRGPGFSAVLARDLRRLRPGRVVCVRPGDWRVLRVLEGTARKAGVPFEMREDRRFYDAPASFAAFAEGRRRLVLEDFYRALRRRHGTLLDARGGPVGGAWNFDRENRAAFGRGGPGPVPPPPRFRDDAVRRAVRELVARRYAAHPGSLEQLDLVPLTPREARALLADFVEKRLARFGRHQDAMWSGEPFLFHSRLSFALNVGLLSPHECLEAALEALAAKRAPLSSVEGFVRQILGWREFVRGIYWRFMPEYAGRNALGCEDVGVPAAFWDGETEMRCVAEAMRGVLAHGYAHHIQRLMVLGLFALLLGVHPYRFHEWHMAVYLDAVDWASLPNTLGMSQWGDGGTAGTKPYCASGAYVARMSDHCRGCRYDPSRATGEDACPLTALYWDFLARHRERFAGNRRMGFQLRNLERRPRAELVTIRREAASLRERVLGGSRV
jgi:deoxyribodipyrimidine photolyase-related protein